MYVDICIYNSELYCEDELFIIWFNPNIFKLKKEFLLPLSYEITTQSMIFF